MISPVARSKRRGAAARKAELELEARSPASPDPPTGATPTVDGGEARQCQVPPDARSFITRSPYGVSVRYIRIVPLFRVYNTLNFNLNLVSICLPSGWGD